MRHTPLALIALAVISTTAAGQSGADQKRGTGRDADWGAVLKDNRIGMKLSNGDVEDMDPVKRLIDKRKDLKLSDEQQQKLKDIQGKTKEINKPLFKQLDSLRQAMRPRAGFDEDADRARMALAREAAANTVVNIRANFATGLTEAKPILTPDQTPKADELLAKQAQDAEETLRKEMGMSGAPGGGGGGRRGGRPPQ
jgi:Spy/CpxP family protein refolding chaperone